MRKAVNEHHTLKKFSIQDHITIQYYSSRSKLYRCHDLRIHESKGDQAIHLYIRLHHPKVAKKVRNLHLKKSSALILGFSLANLVANLIHWKQSGGVREISSRS